MALVVYQKPSEVEPSEEWWASIATSGYTHVKVTEEVGFSTEEVIAYLNAQ
eukprot:COSAG05_NODE_3020_length_2409_cov_1.290783_1_plen_51_part_00